MSAQRQKGTRWETAIVDLLNERGHKSDRVPMSGAKDRGDIQFFNLPIIIEAKNHKRLDLSTWVDESIVEAENHGSEIGVVWHHRPRKGKPEDGYVTMSGEMFLKLVGMISDS